MNHNKKRIYENIDELTDNFPSLALSISINFTRIAKIKKESKNGKF